MHDTTPSPSSHEPHAPQPPAPSRGRRVAGGLALLITGAGLTALALEGVVPRADAQAASATPVRAETRPPVVVPSAGARASYADVLEPAMRAVVQIQSTKRVRPSEGRSRERQGLPDWFPFPLPDQEMPDFDSDSMGSGVIVRGDGVILTNNHVVDGADEVRVQLADKRELRATVVGTDPATDIAVLRVEGRELPYLRLGSSADLRVGDVVFAVGSPFELMQTATMGIVSAIGRNLGITRSRGEAGYEAFIQTDAAINRGNSGGPLLDSRGEVVGINTAIYGGQTGNVGIGFAVPADLVRVVMDQLLADGRVVRSQLGVLIRPVDTALARSYGLDRPDGAIVTRVLPGSPAERADVRVGDLINELDGKPVTDDSQLRIDIANRRPGASVRLGLIGEDGRKRTIEATLRERTGTDETDALEDPSSGVVTDESNALRGLEVAELDKLTPAQRERLHLPENATGVVVTKVERGSPAARAGLMPNVVIEQIDRQPVRSVSDFKALAKDHGDDVVRLRILRGDNVDIVAVEP